MIGGSPFFQRRNPTKAELAKIKTFNESINRTNQIVLGYVVVKHGREKCALAPLKSLPQSLTSVARSGRSGVTVWIIS